MPVRVINKWPSVFMQDLVRQALDSIDLSEGMGTLQWATYDEIDHELSNTPSHRRTVYSSSYTFRKALIRKHFLSRTIAQRGIKNSTSVLKEAIPQTFELELSFADELDELFSDDLWELGKELENPRKWWILKPSMADCGNGIRLFNSRDGLEKIFQEFEDEEESTPEDSTSIITSQLRHFVIQEYILTPLLFDPSEACLTDGRVVNNQKGYKFHLRAYCVASGALTLYLYDRILALFSSAPYSSPENDKLQDLSGHLTNTSLQARPSKHAVRLLDELVGCRILSGNSNAKLTNADVTSIVRQMIEILAETFRAALDTPIYFQTLPNAFELFGIDFLVSHNPHASAPFQVKLLEINAEPAIEMTGPRLQFILNDLFVSIAQICVKPFFVRESESQDVWAVGESRHRFTKCLEQGIRGAIN